MIPKKKPAVLEPSSQRKTNAVTDPPNPSSLALSPQEVVERLRRALKRVELLPLPEGEEGTALLDALELANQIRDKVRAKAREALLEEPGLIPHWSAKESAPFRELSTDAVVVFERLHETDPALTARLFLQACAPTLAGVLKLMYALNPGTARPEVEAWVERQLGELLKLRAPVVRLYRDISLKRQAEEADQ